MKPRNPHPKVSPLPPTVEPQEVCATSFGLEALVTVLSACILEPLRLRTNDLVLFARSRDVLAKLLAPLPPWVEETYAGPPGGRILYADWLLRRAGFVEVGGDDEQYPQLLVRDEGRDWLGWPVKAQLRYLLDQVKKPLWRSGNPLGIEFLSFVTAGLVDNRVESTDHVAEAFRGLPQGVFFDLADFLRLRSETGNPLVELLRRQQYRWLQSSPEQLAEAWIDQLRRFLSDWLSFFGGVRLGRTKQGDCFALTGIGHYLLGMADDFELAPERPAEIVVQPNFEIVFLSPSPFTEVTLARFAERRGTGVGTLFRITRRSILGAAATGLTAEEALALLRQAAPKGVPDNVAREIRGWFGQCRRITLRPALLLHCPDAEAARRVLAAGGKSVAPITETLVELHEPKEKATLLRKLREVGVFQAE